MLRRQGPSPHLVLRWPGQFGWQAELMKYSMHVFAHAKRGAPLEDLGTLTVSAKPERGELVQFQYRGREATGIVTLIDPHNWERRPDLIPTIHVQIAPQGEAPPKRS